MTTYRGMNAGTGRALDDLDNIRQSIRKILTTRKGTRIMRRDFGSLIPDLIDQPFNAVTRLQLMAATAMAVIQFEPRIRPSAVTISQGGEASTWIVDLTCSLRDGLDAGQQINLSVGI